MLFGIYLKCNWFALFYSIQSEKLSFCRNVYYLKCNNCQKIDGLKVGESGIVYGHRDKMKWLKMVVMEPF